MDLDPLQTCPQCRQRFTYLPNNPRNTFPLLLSCSHSVCYDCVHRNLRRWRDEMGMEDDTPVGHFGRDRAELSQDLEQEEFVNSSLMFCRLCQEDQINPDLLRKLVLNSATQTDILKAFPLDVFTIGWMAASANLPKSLHPYPVEVESTHVDFYSVLEEAKDNSGSKKTQLIE